MTNLNYDNIIQFLEKLPEEIDKNIYEENLNAAQGLKDWTLLGTLADEMLDSGNASYKPWTHYALGFYPYNGCDIYRDDKNRIVFTYIETGGHFPFRRTFIATKKSPFILEPICFNVTVGERENSDFLNLLHTFGLTIEKIDSDLLKFEEVYQIAEDLNIDETSLYRRFFNQMTKEYYYTIITKRQTALFIKNHLKTKANRVFMKGGLTS